MAIKFERLIDDMLAAQSRFAQAWRDGADLTSQQKRDSEIRDACRAEIMVLINETQALRMALQNLAAETNRTLNTIVSATSLKEVRWGGTAGALTNARRTLERT